MSEIKKEERKSCQNSLFTHIKNLKNNILYDFLTNALKHKLFQSSHANWINRKGSDTLEQLPQHIYTHIKYSNLQLVFCAIATSRS